MSDDGKIVQFPKREKKQAKAPAVSKKPVPRVKLRICQSSLNALDDITDRVKAGRLVGFTGLLWDPHEQSFSMWTNMPVEMPAEMSAALYLGGIKLIEDMLLRMATEAWVEVKDAEGEDEQE